MKDAYLSIDLDYWKEHSTQYSANLFFQKVFALKRPITVISQHHLILQDINQEDYKVLYNIDFHSDISEPKARINEGSWVGYVKWQQNARFEWRYPNYQICFKSGYGLCHTGWSPNIKTDPFLHKHLHGWKKIIHKKGLQNIEWTRINKIGICLSDQWTQFQRVKNVLLELKNRGYTENLSQRGKKFYRNIGL